MVKKLASVDDFNKAKNTTKLVVIDFFAEWCGPCKHLAPKIEDMAKEHTDVDFYKIDVDENEEVASSEGISAMPTIKFFKNGKEIDSVVGANETKILEAVKKHK